MKVSELLEMFDTTLVGFGADPTNKKFVQQLFHVVLANIAQVKDDLEFDLTHDEIMNRVFPGLYEIEGAANDNKAEKSAA
jgi:hypothetical protein